MQLYINVMIVQDSLKLATGVARLCLLVKELSKWSVHNENGKRDAAQELSGESRTEGGTSGKKHEKNMKKWRGKSNLYHTILYLGTLNLHFSHGFIMAAKLQELGHLHWQVLEAPTANGFLQSSCGKKAPEILQGQHKQENQCTNHGEGKISPNMENWKDGFCLPDQEHFVFSNKYQKTHRYTPSFWFVASIASGWFENQLVWKSFFAEALSVDPHQKPAGLLFCRWQGAVDFPSNPSIQPKMGSQNIKTSQNIPKLYA